MTSQQLFSVSHSKFMLFSVKLGEILQIAGDSQTGQPQKQLKDVHYGCEG